MYSIPKYDLQTAVELPPCQGPKLRRFRDFAGNIKFKKLLSNPVTEDSGAEKKRVDSSDISTGGHGYVFEIDIEGETFALKIFKFCSIRKLRQAYASAWSDEVNDEILIYHSDPFFAECRAYGRMNEVSSVQESGKRNDPTVISRRKSDRTGRELAAPCHGFLALSTAKYDKIFRESFGIKDWSRSEDDKKLSQDQRQPFRALVKTFLGSEKSMRRPRKMLDDLKDLRSLGIFQRDIFARNYVDGLLVDFSLAETDPYWIWDLIRDEGRLLEKRKNAELHLMLFTELGRQTAASR
ncbi:hypothetical protein EV356DRAFT_56184 [Viridothelium virens]|uniref:Protein kinase domain-containing protein n=1 Tax=Viridothelium virens TaxID=1048519 RepID=A0A6A6GSJ1_VIRVR|nr:hypothetical protein EV356DRAFT_56184 [Viridothelium virens]